MKRTEKLFTWRPEYLINLLVIAFTAWALISSLPWRLDAALFPRLIAIPLLVLCLLQLSLDFKRKEPLPLSDSLSNGDEVETESSIDPDLQRRRMIQLLGWLFGLVVVLWLLGFTVGICLFLLAYLRFQGRESWWLSIVISACAWLVVVYGLGHYMHVSFPVPVLHF